jgi:hypothetical protein
MGSLRTSRQELDFVVVKVETERVKSVIFGQVPEGAQQEFGGDQKEASKG